MVILDKIALVSPRTKTKKPSTMGVDDDSIVARHDVIFPGQFTRRSRRRSFPTTHAART